jgi:hypothetical protein
LIVTYYIYLHIIKDSSAAKIVVEKSVCI